MSHSQFTYILIMSSIAEKAPLAVCYHYYYHSTTWKTQLWRFPSSKHWLSWTPSLDGTTCSTQWKSREVRLRVKDWWKVIKEIGKLVSRILKTLKGIFFGRYTWPKILQSSHPLKNKFIPGCDCCCTRCEEAKLSLWIVQSSLCLCM